MIENYYKYYDLKLGPQFGHSKIEQWRNKQIEEYEIKVILI